MRTDPDLLPQALPEGWLAGVGPHKGAMVVVPWPTASEAHLSPSEKRLLSDGFAQEGLEWDDLYITGLLKRPRASGYIGGQIDASLPYLIEEIQNVVPKYVLALGPLVYHTLTGTKQELSLYRGIWQRLDEVFDWDGAVVLPTYSPAAVLDDPRNKAKQFERDLRHFAKTWVEAPTVSGIMSA